MIYFKSIITLNTQKYSTFFPSHIFIFLFHFSSIYTVCPFTNYCSVVTFVFNLHTKIIRDLPTSFFFLILFSIIVCLGVWLFKFCGDLLPSWNWILKSVPRFGNFLATFSLNKFSAPFLASSPSETPSMLRLLLLMISQNSLFHSFFFLFLCMISNDLYFSFFRQFIDLYLFRICCGSFMVSFGNVLFPSLSVILVALCLCLSIWKAPPLVFTDWLQ